MNILSLINSGGIISYLLILLSILSIGIIINKFYFFIKISKYNSSNFLNDIKNKKQIFNNNLFINLFNTIKKFSDKKDEQIKIYLNKEIEKNIKILSKYIIILGTIANISVYLGLLGTIIGIIEAFSNISSQGLGGINIVIGGVSKALITTAIGLIVAIPATIFYNFFIEKVDLFIKDMELFCDEVLILIKNDDI